MASQKQIEANRRNAQKSTGPKTPEGKARSSMNALRHGLTAENTVTQGEDENEFNQVQTDFYDHLQPQGPVEAHLVLEVVNASWRLRRMHMLETGVFDLRFMDLEEKMEEDYEGTSDQTRKALIYREDTKGPNTLDKLSRYQARAERSFYKALHELERLQSLRGPTATVALPARTEPRATASGSSPDAAPAPLPQPVDPLPLAAQNDFGQTNPIAALPETESEPRPLGSVGSPSLSPRPAAGAASPSSPACRAFHSTVSSSTLVTH